MTPELFGLLSLLFVIALLTAVWLGWRSRGRKQRDLPAPQRPHAHVATLTAPMLYVATTRAGDPYDRITVHGLGFRARGELLVGTSGVVLALPKQDVLIPAAAIEGVERATWTIDRVVEPGGLVRITWRLGEARLDTNLRITGDDEQVLAALRDLLPHDTAQGAAA